MYPPVERLLRCKLSEIAMNHKINWLLCVYILVDEVVLIGLFLTG
jgi:hypothetical protein